MSIRLKYVLTRLPIVVALALLAALAGGSVWLVGAVAGAAGAAIALVPGGGRYGVRSGPRGVALERDERGRLIADRAARNGFVVVVVALGAASIVLHASGRSVVPGYLLDLILAAGVLTWMGSDLLQRRP